MKLYIIRHAESYGNATGNYSTDASDSLSSKGEIQAEALAEGLESLEFDKIIVSPRLRTMQTIAPYLKRTAQIGEIWPELAEACWHEERESKAEIWNSIPSQLTDPQKEIFTFRDNKSVIPEHIETFGQGLCRVHETLERIQKMAKESCNSVLMVTHGHFIREFLNLIIDTRNTFNFHMDNCGMILLTFKMEWEMQYFNRIHGTISKQSKD